MPPTDDLLNPLSRAVTRRDFLARGSAAVLAGRAALVTMPWRQAQRPVPSAAQLAWQRDELALFLHFGVNTFSDREWGDGKEDPASFAPSALDGRQWARAARAAGFKAMILTAKHHDGFCLWPTRTTTHSVARSPFRGGSGDVVREFTDACRAEGLKAGLYCSPWDRNAPAYGDSPRYNDMLCDQLSELLTNYGRIDEVWFDGANGEGPNGKKQVYDWPRFFAHVKRLQPETVVFSDAGPDVRWIGNESGSAGMTNWSTVNPEAVPYPGVSGPNVIKSLQEGDPNGTVWRPGETDVSIRPGWFYHPADDARVRSVDNLVSLYFSSVGRNSKLLLNVPPTRAGLLHEVDVDRLAGMHERLTSEFRQDLTSATRASQQFQVMTDHAGLLAVVLDGAHRVGVARLSEDIARGQRVSSYQLQAEMSDGWKTLSEGTTIGYCKLDRFESVAASRFRVRLQTVAPPETLRLGLFGAE